MVLARWRLALVCLATVFGCAAEDHDVVSSCEEADDATSGSACDFEDLCPFDPNACAGGDPFFEWCNGGVLERRMVDCLSPRDAGPPGA